MRIWLALSLGMALGCSTSRVDGSVSPTGLTVAVATDRASVRLNDQLRITITVTNNSASSRTLRFSSGCQTDFEFLDAQGTVVRSSHQLCPQALMQRTLAPGNAFTDIHTWTRGPLDPPELATGAYQLRGVLLATDEMVRSAPVAVSIP